MNTASERPGKIVTFYSYKGGTGRSMALANVAWVLASRGKRVLAIDWDLEAPGLHRYLEPFLTDKSLERSTGVIDFVRDFTTAALTSESSSQSKWYEKYSNMLAHAVPVNWDFGDGGLLHLIPAGRQDAAYGVRINSFDWQKFYERLGGGILLEAVKQSLRAVYDYVLIDSRTGVSDTSGICTIQMPDELVVCFTLNRQSIYGASHAARSAFKQRHSPSGEPTLVVWPVPTRVEMSEKDRLDVAFTMARARFSGLMHQLSPVDEDAYWGDIAVGYEAYYAYEEVLSTFRDRPRQTASMLARMERIAELLSREQLSPAKPIDELRRSEGLIAFTTHSAEDFRQELDWLSDEYESLRKRMDTGAARTELMTLLIGRAQTLGAQRDAGRVGESLFARGTEGSRVIGIALAATDPQRKHIELALSGISEMRSPFEQYYALLLAERLAPLLHPSAAGQLQIAVTDQLGMTIRQDDPSRWTVAQRLVSKLLITSIPDVVGNINELAYRVAGRSYSLVDVLPRSSHIRYQDVSETHGPWVASREAHAFQLPRAFRMGRYLVTNSLYLKFIQSDGYKNDLYWRIGRHARSAFVTRDGESLGPESWPTSTTIPDGKEEHPVTSLSYFEAHAFVNWCNSVTKPSSDWEWTLPTEDCWEFAARSDQGFIYPWGDAFDSTKCNSSENGINDTSEVTLYQTGASTVGCCDMAGNVWEFVLASDAGNSSCVLRGGSFKNDRFVVRSYLRLFGVPTNHRAADFGLRLAQIKSD